METVLRSARGTVTVGPDRPIVVIGERINPTGRKKLAAALLAGDMALIQQEAVEQVRAGAHVLDVNVGAAGVDHVPAMKAAVAAVVAVVPVPLSIDSNSAEVLAAGLQAFRGKALVNSVNGEESSLASVLPLVKEFGAAVIGLCLDADGIATDPGKRLEIARKILSRAERHGIPPEDVVIDPLVMTVGADDQAARVTLETARLVRRELGVNLTAGVSNVSFGLPDRKVLNQVLLAMLLAAGVDCPIIDPTVPEISQTVIAADLLSGHDAFARRYLAAYRARQEAHETEGARA